MEVDPGILPPDAKYKGCEDVVVQDIVLGTNNVLFHKQKYYSRSTRQSYQAELPRGYSGQFGPGIQISEGEISNWLIGERESFHAEKDAVYEAGLASSPYQQTDDTLTRLDGQNQHCHVVCNPVYTAYHTRPSKERISVLDVLRNGRQRIFRLNDEALGYLESQLKWSKAVWGTMQRWATNKTWMSLRF